MYDPFDHYFKKAQEQGYKARSAFKLEEIHEKFRIFDKTVRTVCDIGCAPGSWLQYTASQLRNTKDAKIIGFDIKAVDLNLPGVHTYVQDITDHAAVQSILDTHHIKQFDLLISDMAPNTMGLKDLDAMRLFNLLDMTMWMYETLLKKNGKFVTKVFMGSGFEQYVKKMKDIFGGKSIKVFKPESCRKESKETYVIKI